MTRLATLIIAVTLAVGTASCGGSNLDSRVSKYIGHAVHNCSHSGGAAGLKFVNCDGLSVLENSSGKILSDSR